MDVAAAAPRVGRRREGGEQQHLGDGPGPPGRLNRSHPCLRVSGYLAE